MNKAGLYTYIGDKRYSLETPGQQSAAKLALLQNNTSCVIVRRSNQSTVYVFTMAGFEMASEWRSQ